MIDRKHSLEVLRKELEEKERIINRLNSELQDSEDRYSRMLYNLKEEYLFFQHDTDGNFTYISPSYKNILGFAPEEYIGLKTSELWSPNPINKTAERATQLSCQGIKQPPYEIEIYHKSGALRRFVAIETPLFDEAGNVIAVEGTTRDITEKRKIEEQLDKYRQTLEELVLQRTEELEVSRKQLADIIEFLPHPLFVVDVEEKIIAWNMAMVELSGQKKEDVLGKEYHHCLKQFYESSDPFLVQLILDGLYKEDGRNSEEVLALRQEAGIEFEGRKVVTERILPDFGDGKKRNLLIAAGPILDNEDNLIGAIAAIRDITQLKKAEQKILQSERRLSTLMSNLPGMAYRISFVEGEWKVDFVSEGCEQMFGRKPSFFLSSSLKDLKMLIHEDDIERVLELASEAVALGKSFECEYRIVTSNGQTKWVFDKTEIIKRNVDGRISAEGFMADFTVFKKKEEKLLNENILLRSTIRDRHKFDKIIGNCRAMQDVFDLIVKSATTNDNVCIFGESGTGKELVAQAIHDVSDRKNKQFVAVNCAAIPESLIESEFFGTARGAYTGADSNKKGYLETAGGGTLFLDEIGDISPNLQVKLLRAIDGGGFSPVGSRKVVHPDLRIIAASNKDIKHLIGGGEMRQDFFFRIHVIPVHLPPLRERGDDIYMLINHFFKEFGTTESITSLSSEELEALKNHRWPGNVRELQNVLRRFVTLKNLHFMEMPQLPKKQALQADTTVLAPEGKGLKTNIVQMEKAMILKVLGQTSWNRSKAAAELGVSRRTLYRKMKSLGL